MTLYELMILFTDESQTIELFDCDKGETVFHGELFDMPSKFEDREVLSIDTLYEDTQTITINI